MNDAAPQTEAIAHKAASATAAPLPAKHPPSRIAPLSILAFLLLAGGLVALTLRQETRAREQEQRATALEAQLAALQSTAGNDGELDAVRRAQDEQAARLEQAMQVLREELSAANARLAGQTAQLDTVNRELAATNERLRASEADVEQDWMLAEAQSLLRLAAERLTLARDVDAAIALYQAASKLLAQLGEPAHAAARDALAQELRTLQSLPRVATVDVYERLGVQAARIDNFAVVADAGAVTDFTVPAVQAGVDEADGWFAAATNSLRQYFVVTRRDEAVTPLLTAEEEYLIRRSIRLKIEEARLALLQGEQEIYRVALADALAAIEAELQPVELGQMDASARDTLVAELNTLRDTAIVVDIPPLGTALELLGGSTL